MQEIQADLSAQVQRVRRKARPWKSIIALLFAIAAAVISNQARHDSHTLYTASHVTNQIVAYGTAALFGVFGAVATYGLAGQSRQVLEPRAGTAHSAVVGYAILIVGAFATLAITLDLFDVPVGQLVLGGALTSVFVGIAAQQALGNIFAGLVLMFARPFRVGDAIRLRAGALGGTLDGTVIDIGITYVRVVCRWQRDVRSERAGAQRGGRSDPACKREHSPGPRRRRRQVRHSGRPGATAASAAGTGLTGLGIRQ